MNRYEEFSFKYYKWIVKCLIKDDKKEALTYFLLGCDLCVRQQELNSICWNQITSLQYAENVRISKLIHGNKEQGCYMPLKISDATMELLDEIRDDRKEKIFKKQPSWYIEQIRESCGDSRFCGHDIRAIGIALKNIDYESR